MSSLRVLCHLGDADDIRLPADLRGRVDVVRVPVRGELDPDLQGDCLFTMARSVDTLPEAVRRVRWVHVAGTGLDQFPLDAVPDGVVVTNSRGANAVAISEWVLAMMLAFEKRLPETWIDRPYDDRERFAQEPLGTLRGRSLGLVGLGTIGLATAQRALAFGMEVRALRRSAAASPHPDVELALSFADLAGRADHLVLAAPLTPETHHLLNHETFALCKPGVHLVNVARGGFVDQDALRAALDDGMVAKASLDTFDPEPLPEGHWLYGHPGVRLSAHMSWSEPNAFEVIFERFASNVRRFLDGRPLENVVDPKVGY
jgi:phosphoglycerate dehydrogenase-like enzyme